MVLTNFQQRAVVLCFMCRSGQEFHTHTHTRPNDRHTSALDTRARRSEATNTPDSFSLIERHRTTPENCEERANRRVGRHGHSINLTAITIFAGRSVARESSGNRASQADLSPAVYRYGWIFAVGLSVQCVRERVSSIARVIYRRSNEVSHYLTRISRAHERMLAREKVLANRNERG